MQRRKWDPLCKAGTLKASPRWRGELEEAPLLAWRTSKETLPLEGEAGPVRICTNVQAWDSNLHCAIQELPGWGINIKIIPSLKHWGGSNKKIYCTCPVPSHTAFPQSPSKHEHQRLNMHIHTWICVCTCMCRRNLSWWRHNESRIRIKLIRTSDSKLLDKYYIIYMF